MDILQLVEKGEGYGKIFFLLNGTIKYSHQKIMHPISKGLAKLLTLRVLHFVMTSGTEDIKHTLYIPGFIGPNR